MYRVRREVGRMGCYVGRVRENHESGVLANYGRMRSTGVYNAEGVVGPTLCDTSTSSATKRHRALLLELLRIFGHQLDLGPDARTLLTGIRNAKGIRKPSTGRKKHFETKPTQNASFGKLDAEMLHLGNSHLFHSLICGPFCSGSSTS